MKFKPGDEVAIVKCIKNSQTLDEKNWKLGDSFIVYKVTRSTGSVLYAPDRNCCWVFEEELEFKHIYESPLYKALL